jgi:hypothetical protein
MAKPKFLEVKAGRTYSQNCTLSGEISYHLNPLHRQARRAIETAISIGPIGMTTFTVFYYYYLYYYYYYYYYLYP